MAEIKDVYKLVKFVDTNKYLSNSQGISDGDRVFDNLVKLHSKRKFWRDRTTTSVKRTIKSAKRSQYIDITVEPPDNGIYYVTDENGSHLLAKKWFIYPAGLIDESPKKYSESRIFFTGAFMSGLIILVITGSWNILASLFVN